jgi:hypothetical protein
MRIVEGRDAEPFLDNRSIFRRDLDKFDFHTFGRVPGNIAYGREI